MGCKTPNLDYDKLNDNSILILIKLDSQALSTTTLMFYIGTTIDLFVSTKAVAIKSIISKTIPAQELGKIFSVMGIIGEDKFHSTPGSAKH